MKKDQLLSQLPHGWKSKKISSICRVVPGSTPQTDRREYWDGDIFWITPMDLGMLKEISITNSERKITKLGYDSCGTQMVPINSVIMSSRAPIGHLGISKVQLCTNQGCKSFVPIEETDFLFLYYLLKNIVIDLQHIGSGSTFKEVSKTQLENYVIAIPGLIEQRRIAKELEKKLSILNDAKEKIIFQQNSARTLTLTYLKKTFDDTQGMKWGKKPLKDVCDLLNAKPIALNGDKEVIAITSACLTEEGFNPFGVKTAKMWADDAEQCVVQAGEVLIARSNTPDLVGRVSLFEGEPIGAVASDLTIRMLPKDSDELNARFLTQYLSYLFISGHWKTRAGGASGTMKKITRSQIRNEPIPIPKINDQNMISKDLFEKFSLVKQLQNTLREQSILINKTSKTILNAAFRGEI